MRGVGSRNYPNLGATALIGCVKRRHEGEGPLTRLAPTSSQKDFWWMYPVPSILAAVKLLAPGSKAASGVQFNRNLGFRDEFRDRFRDNLGDNFSTREQEF